MKTLTESQLAFRETMEQVIYEEAHPVTGIPYFGEDQDYENRQLHYLYDNIEKIYLQCGVSSDQDTFTLDQICKALNIIDHEC